MYLSKGRSTGIFNSLEREHKSLHQLVEGNYPMLKISFASRYRPERDSIPQP
jgi:hypothetical protein